MWPYNIVAFERIPIRCTLRATSSHRAPEILCPAINGRARWAKISAPPPGISTLAKLAVDDTNVRVIDMPVDIVVGEILVQPFADVIRQTAHGHNIVHAIQFDALIK